jgi:hypothetical protein
MNGWTRAADLVIVLALLAGVACSKPSSATAGPSASSSAAPSASSAPAENPLAAGVRKDFGTTFSCPEERVAVKERSDIDPVQALAPGTVFAMGTPPDEVKADPERLAKWTSDQKAKIDGQRASYTGQTIFEVTGCGHTQFLGCRPHHRGGSVFPNWPDCAEAKGLGPDGGPASEGMTVDALHALPGASLRWTPLQGAADVVGDRERLDVMANLDWATAIATAFSPDAKLYRLALERLGADGSADLSVRGTSTVTFYFNSVAKGDVDFAIDLFPRSHRRGANPPAVDVEVSAHHDTTRRDAVGKPACTLQRAVAAGRTSGRLAKLDPIYGLGADLEVRSGKSSWYFSFAIAGAGAGETVDATTCAIVK